MAHAFMATGFLPQGAAEYVVARLALPGRPPASFGVFLFDPATNRFGLRMREDIGAIADEEDAEVLAEYEPHFRELASELGGRETLRLLEENASGVLEVTERRRVRVRSFEWTLNRLFDEHVLGVEPAKVVPFVTHLPLLTLQAAATRFGEDMEVEPEDWVEVPGRRLTDDMYVVHVVGRSMLPKIPDGSLAVFRYKPAGSRNGKIVLVWHRGSSAAGGQFTVKVYESVKNVTEEGYEHTGIRLKPLNPEFDELVLDEHSDFSVLGEFVCVLE